jgi:hypothetical protein
MVVGGTGNTSIRTYHFHRDTTLAGGGGYADNGPYNFIDEIDQTPFISINLQFINAGAADMFFSFDGVNDHGRFIPGQDLTQSLRREKRVWLRGVAGQAYRFWAW